MIAKSVTVEKRDGSKVPYDVLKIKQSIAHAVEGTGANPLALEASLDQFIQSGKAVKSAEIQQNIIQRAVQLATAQEPEWLNVAGRAYAADMWATYSLKGKTFLEIVEANVKSGEYSEDLVSVYSDKQIEAFGKLIRYERDLGHSHSSLVTVANKYLGKGELNQHMHMVNAMRFAQYESVEDRDNAVKEFYDVLSLRKLSLATPFMSNLRKGGNTASCFILAIEDDLDSIFDNIKRMANISKNGGGIGVFLGYLRAKGSDVGGAENAAGCVTQWVKIINDTMVAVNQGGKRAGAATVALPIWHNDIQDFLDMQTEHGDMRLKSFDVFPQVTVPNLFMERDKAGEPFLTFCPFEVKQKLGIDIRGMYGLAFEQAYSKIERAFYAGKLKVAKLIPNARDLMKLIMRTMLDTGLPYLSFTDTINERNPNKSHKGSYGIPCTNLCVESYSNVRPDTYIHVCNLASINLGNIVDHAELASVAQTATKMLDYGINLTDAPGELCIAHNNEFRTVGIGIMGLNDYLAKRRMSYKNLDEISLVAETVELNAAFQSTKLAQKYGKFGAYENSTWASGEQTAYFASHSKDNKEAWAALQLEIDKHGMRHSQLTSPAPTTSTSIYQEASASFLPVYGAFFSEDNKNGSLMVAAKYLKENPIGYGKNLAKFDAKEIVDVAAALQKFIDTGISMELLFDQNKEGFKAKDLYDALHYAHSSGIKATYYIRTIKKGAANMIKEDACVGCAG